MGPLNVRFLGFLLLALLALLGAERAAAFWMPTGVFQPHPVLGYVRRPGPEALSSWREGREVPWPAPGQGVRILILGAPRVSRYHGQHAAPLVARLVEADLRKARPGTPLTVGASLQENYDLAQTLLLADRLVPRLRPDLLALTFLRVGDLEYTPAPPPGLLDRLTERLMATHLVSAALFALRPNLRTGDFSERPSDLMLQHPVGAPDPSGGPPYQRLKALETTTRLLVFPCRETLGFRAEGEAGKLAAARLRVSWLDEAGPVRTEEDLARALASGLEAALP